MVDIQLPVCPTRRAAACSLLLLGMSLIVVISAHAQSFVPPDWTLIAHYPLQVSGDDTTGNNGPMAITRAPFENGGLFLNGIGTQSTNDDYSEARSPFIPGLNFDAFAISAEFHTDSLQGNPVLVGGNSWRWAGIWIRDDSLMNLRLNDKTVDFLGTEKWSTGTWHETGVLVDGDSVSLFLDGQVSVREAVELQTDEDRTVSFSDGGLGITLFGTVRNLKIHTKSPIETATERGREIPSRGMLVNVYPNPITRSQGLSILSGENGAVRVSILDILGREVWHVDSHRLSVGANRLPVDLGGLNSGLYIVRIEESDRVETRPIVIVR